MPQAQAGCVCGRLYWPNQAWMHSGCQARPVSNEEPAASVSNSSVSNPDYFRVKLWREANRERYNAGQREYMRKRRATQA